MQSQGILTDLSGPKQSKVVNRKYLTVRKMHLLLYTSKRQDTNGFENSNGYQFVIHVEIRSDFLTYFFVLFTFFCCN